MSKAYEVVVFSKTDKHGQSRILGEATFGNYDDTQLYIQNFKRVSPNVGCTMVYHPSTTRTKDDDTLGNFLRGSHEQV